MKLSSSVLTKLCMAGVVVAGAGCESAYLANAKPTTPMVIVEEPAYVEPVYVEPEYLEPAFVEPAYAQPPPSHTPVYVPSQSDPCPGCGLG